MVGAVPCDADSGSGSSVAGLIAPKSPAVDTSLDAQLVESHAAAVSPGTAGRRSGGAITGSSGRSGSGLTSWLMPSTSATMYDLALNFHGMLSHVVRNGPARRGAA
eukprot:356840-Chlamydomonas_euryale.AAC.1